MRPLLLLCAAGALLAADATAARPAWLGVGLDEVDAPLAHHLALADDLGVLVTQVLPGSPAAAMGLQTWDVLVALDGRPMYTPRAVQQAIAGKQPGTAIQLGIRRGAAQLELRGELVARPPEPFQPDALDPEALRHRLLDRLRPNGKEAAPRRSGKVTQPDGSVMEWSVEEP